MKRWIITANDAVWIATAIACVFVDHPVLTGIVCVTTVIYAADLLAKLKEMDYRVVPFVKRYWLDILFLVPVCKIFRGFRILKVGTLLRAADAGMDFTEIAWRAVNFIRTHRVPPEESR